ncbi:hypothetical protein [Hyphomicrobium sp. CS1GBMeth3]|uniref:hypothetical protein n=1 Tax=Hyphomicrobium sp. CS1GBMeth3 TaxID=1892845 RepID=UPI0009FAD4F5|nr:hypothetical protein [Hyphomicrobium sp. CS1GBMeth3]
MQRSTAVHAICAVSAAFLLSVPVLTTPAEAGGRSWSRGGWVSGPNGRTAAWQRSGHCEGGTCSREGSYTGRAGSTWTREGSISRTENGWEGQRTIAGSNGGSVTRSRSARRAP